MGKWTEPWKHEPHKLDETFIDFTNKRERKKHLNMFELIYLMINFN